MASLSLRHVYKKYPGNVVAVKDFNLEIEDKEFIIFVGPSGCGKSTTLRMIAGLEDISEGELYIGDTLANDVPPKDRDIAMVFQSYENPAGKRLRLSVEEVADVEDLSGFFHATVDFRLGILSQLQTERHVFTDG
ncbi:MAG: ABC transporter ATP-binding protein, partial [Clostridia bacterium]|nr:ABC transporter ATP-binding protein [Clostridia bacterium]